MKRGRRGFEDCAAGDSDDNKGAAGDGTHQAAAAHRASGRKLLSALQGVGENPAQETAENDEQRDELLELRDPSGPARWAARRACGSGLGELAKPGRAKGTRDALTAAHTLTCVCCTPGCVALVDLQAARTAARAAARSTFAPGDGCAGRDCCATRGARFQPGRFRARQQGMAAAVKDGERKLLRWPASILTFFETSELRGVLSTPTIRVPNVSGAIGGTKYPY